MVKEILQYPKDKEILSQKSEPIEEINDEIRQLAEDLLDTLKQYKTGVGISAIQIGIPKQMCIVKYDIYTYIMINPKIIKQRGEQKIKEGCLSAPKDIQTEVTRAQKVWVEYTDLDGKQKELAQGGLCSAIVQHELDHFEGGCKVFEEVDTQIKIQEIMKQQYAKQGMDYNDGVPVMTAPGQGGINGIHR